MKVGDKVRIIQGEFMDPIGSIGKIVYIHEDGDLLLDVEGFTDGHSGDVDAPAHLSAKLYNSGWWIHPHEIELLGSWTHNFFKGL